MFSVVARCSRWRIIAKPKATPRRGSSDWRILSSDMVKKLPRCALSSNAGGSGLSCALVCRDKQAARQLAIFGYAIAKLLRSCLTSQNHCDRTFHPQYTTTKHRDRVQTLLHGTASERMGSIPLQHMMWTSYMLHRQPQPPPQRLSAGMQTLLILSSGSFLESTRYIQHSRISTTSSKECDRER